MEVSIELGFFTEEDFDSLSNFLLNNAGIEPLPPRMGAGEIITLQMTVVVPEQDRVRVDNLVHSWRMTQRQN